LIGTQTVATIVTNGFGVAFVIFTPLKYTTFSGLQFSGSDSHPH